MPRFMRSVLPTVVSLALLPVALASTSLTLVNKCNEELFVLVDGKSVGKLPPKGGSATAKLPDDFQGGIIGQKDPGTRTPQVNLRPKNGFYFILLDGGSFTRGVSIRPNHKPENGFCDEVICTDPGCASAFRTRPSSLPAVSPKAPASPLFQCANSDGFVVTFCPDGPPPTLSSISLDKPKPSQMEPTPTHHHHPPPPPSNHVPGRRSRRIHPDGNTDKCLGTLEDRRENGIPVQLVECKDQRQHWEFNDNAPTQVKLAGTNLCLDADAAPNNGVKLHLWECNGKPQQNWFYTSDNRLALVGKWQNGKFVSQRTNRPDAIGLCMDLTNGDFDSGNRIQVWRCTDRNQNQVWTL